MPTVAELEAAFRVHLDEMERCERAACLWALLHLTVIVPDICGALESHGGRATPAAYVGWCRRMLPAAPLTAEERYEMRCILLHQGRTLASKGRYAYFKFMPPPPSPDIKLHGTHPADGQVVLDVVVLATEMKQALRKWSADLQDPSQAATAATVAQNLPTLVTVKSMPVPTVGDFTVPFIGGYTVNVTHTSTST